MPATSAREGASRLIEVMDAHCAIELKAPGFEQGRRDCGALLATPAVPRADVRFFVGDDSDRRERASRSSPRAAALAYSVGRRRPGASRRLPRAARPCAAWLAEFAGRGEGRMTGAAADQKSQNLDLALIGNCYTAALVDRHARIVWWCFPRWIPIRCFQFLAGDEEKGFCEVELADLVEPSRATFATRRSSRRS